MSGAQETDYALFSIDRFTVVYMAGDQGRSEYFFGQGLAHSSEAILDEGRDPHRDTGTPRVHANRRPETGTRLSMPHRGHSSFSSAAKAVGDEIRGRAIVDEAVSRVARRKWGTSNRLESGEAVSFSSWAPSSVELRNISA